MVEVSETIHINAAPEAVFEFMDDPENHVVVTPSLAHVQNIRPLDNGGKRLEHTFRMAGIGLDGELIEREREEGRQMLFEMTGDLTGEIELTFEPEGEGTKMTYTGRYNLPGQVLGRVAEPFVRRYNERELQTTLENVRTHVEATGA